MKIVVLRYCEKMKISLIIMTTILLTISKAVPQKEGAVYIQEAIREIQQRQLVPPNAQIYNVSNTIILNVRKDSEFYKFKWETPTHIFSLITDFKRF